MMVTVYDYDYNGDDFLGYIEIKYDLTSNNGEWIN